MEARVSQSSFWGRGGWGVVVDGIKRAGGKHHSDGILAGRLSQADSFDSGDTLAGFEIFHPPPWPRSFAPWGKFTHSSEPASSPENGDNNCTHL